MPSVISYTELRSNFLDLISYLDSAESFKDEAEQLETVLKEIADKYDMDLRGKVNFNE